MTTEAFSTFHLLNVTDFNILRVCYQQQIVTFFMK
jgi:hypothetical protein